MSSRRLGLIAFLAAALLPAWAARAGTIRSDRDDMSYVLLAASAPYQSSGSFDITGTTEFIGSGTLIDDNWVLTAAHLLEGASSGTFHVGGQDYAISGWIAHPAWKGDARKGNDLALVRLASPVLNVTPAGLYRAKDEFLQTGVFVGNGRTGTGDTGAITYDAVPRATTNVIDGMSVGKQKVYTSKLKKSTKIFVVDFDNPARPGDNVIGSATPTDLEGLISLGDSGGGVFLPGSDGTMQIAGIHSYGEAPVGLDDSGYGDVTGHTRVSLYAKWIDKQIKRDRPTTLALPFLTSTSFRSLEVGDLAGSTAIGAVPEPTSAGLLLLGSASLLSRRKRVGDFSATSRFSRRSRSM